MKHFAFKKRSPCSSITENLIERICLIFSVTEYFKGNNWKVHPDWVYCEYSSASEKWFPSPEERVLHFLTRTRSPGWKWMSLRPRSPSSHHKQASKPDKDAYYCMYLSRSYDCAISYIFMIQNNYICYLPMMDYR